MKAIGLLLKLFTILITFQGNLIISKEIQVLKIRKKKPLYFQSDPALSEYSNISKEIRVFVKGL